MFEKEVEQTEPNKLCVDCGVEESNPGLDCCGECYQLRIWGNGD